MGIHAHRFVDQYIVFTFLTGSQFDVILCTVQFPHVLISLCVYLMTRHVNSGKVKFISETVRHCHMLDKSRYVVTRAKLCPLQTCVTCLSRYTWLVTLCTYSYNQTVSLYMHNIIRILCLLQSKYRYYQQNAGYIDVYTEIYTQNAFYTYTGTIVT